MSAVDKDNFDYVATISWISNTNPKLKAVLMDIVLKIYAYVLLYISGGKGLFIFFTIKGSLKMDVFYLPMC